MIRHPGAAAGRHRRMMRTMAWALGEPRRYLRSLGIALKLTKFIGSAEYSEISGVFPLHLPELDIELSATPEQRSRMLAGIEQSWTHMGDVGAHHSVVSTDEFRPENIHGSIDRFWASGDAEADLAAFLLQRLGCGELAQKTCVEYGCGVGRVTIPLAARFAEVCSYDISPSHLALARQRAEAMGVDNVRFHCCAGGLPDRLESCDFFYSRLVFQHNPPPIIRELIGLALGSLRPGGIAIFGVPIYLSGYHFRIEEYLAEPRSRRMEMHCIPQHEVFSLIDAAKCSPIEVREERRVAADGEGLGGGEGEGLANLFVVRRPPMTERAISPAPRSIG